MTPGHPQGSPPTPPHMVLDYRNEGGQPKCFGLEILVGALPPQRATPRPAQDRHDYVLPQQVMTSRHDPFTTPRGRTCARCDDDFVAS